MRSSRDESGPGDAESTPDWHRYRCPVCGHTDAVSLQPDAPVHILCTHCETALEVRLSSGTTERAEVQVRTDL
jgi:transcription elongation factor Elf1